MCVRHLGFILLVWFPGVVHAQSAAQPCLAPSLDDGYVVPEQKTYSHQTNLTYACNNGHKPAAESWWATITCHNGKWSHEPQCIDNKACIPPVIPNAKYTESPNGWYENGDKIRIKCDKGYTHKDLNATAECINGTWSPVPVCERSIHACGEPPQIPHAVIIQGYQELFAVDSEVKYECEDGYTVEGGDSNKKIFCISGIWTESPTCTKEIRPATGHGGSTVGATDGGDATSAGSGTRPVAGGSSPGAGHGGSAGGRHTTSAGGGTRPGGGSNLGAGHGGSAGGGTRPVGGGSSTSSGLNERKTVPQFTAITSCGKYPIVPESEIMQIGVMFLRYQCGSFYKRVGPEIVKCYSDGTWSEVPTCKANFCSVDTDGHPDLKSIGVQFIKNGETLELECARQEQYLMDNYSVVTCTNGKESISRCCNRIQINMNIC